MRSWLFIPSQDAMLIQSASLSPLRFSTETIPQDDINRHCCGIWNLSIFILIIFLAVTMWLINYLKSLPEFFISHFKLFWSAPLHFTIVAVFCHKSNFVLRVEQSDPCRSQKCYVLHINPSLEIYLRSSDESNLEVSNINICIFIFEKIWNMLASNWS